MTVRSGSVRRSLNRGRYLRHVFLHPAHGIAVLIVVVFGLGIFGPIVTVLACVLLELITVTALPRLPWVRRASDEALAERARALAAEARDGLLRRLSEAHKNELIELEAIASAMGGRSATSADGCADVERLLEVYVRLAIAHHTGTAVLRASGGTDGADVEALRAEQARLPRDAPRVVRDALERRLDVAVRRSEARRAARDELVAMEHELASIKDTLRLMYERLAFGSNDMVRDELHELLAGPDHDARASQALGLGDDGFDPSLLRCERVGTA